MGGNVRCLFDVRCELNEGFDCPAVHLCLKRVFKRFRRKDAVHLEDGIQIERVDQRDAARERIRRLENAADDADLLEEGVEQVQLIIIIVPVERGEEFQRAALADEFLNAVAGAPAAGGLDHDVKAASVRDLHCFFLAVLIDRVDGVYGAQLLCHLALHGDRLNDGDVCAAGVQRQLRHDHAHRAAAGNGDRLAGLDADEVDTVQADGDRLDQRALFETAGVGQLVYGLICSP